MAYSEKTVSVNGLPGGGDSSHWSARSWLRENKSKALSVLGAAAFPILIPFVHLGIVGSWLWSEYDLKVDRTKCTCECWDTVFKGQYEKGVASYKHVYFNVTSNTLKIWATTVFFAVALYECMKRVIRLAYQRRIRFPMFVLLASVIYPHYYSWWSYFNFWNDEYYRQWYHQLYFSTTELVATVCIMIQMDTKVIPNPRLLLVILSVSVFHISASLYDQFLSNVLAGEGALHQVLRDLGFMFPDLLHLWLPYRELRKMNVPLRSLFTVSELMFVVAFLVISWIAILVF